MTTDIPKSEKSKSGLVKMVGALFGNLFKRKNTVMFPAEYVPIPKGFRGFPFVTPEKCNGCKRCVRVCPSRALSIDDTDDGGRKHTTNIARCTRCQQCEESCPNDAIHLTVNELGDILRADVTMDSMVHEVPCLAYKQKEAS